MDKTELIKDIEMRMETAYRNFEKSDRGSVSSAFEFGTYNTFKYVLGHLKELEIWDKSYPKGAEIQAELDMIGETI